MVTLSTPRVSEPRPIGESATIALDRLLPSKANRPVAKDDDLKGLAASIAAVGLLYPLIVRSNPDVPDTFRIIAGERRFRALKRLKAIAAPCVIVSGDSEAPDPEILRVVENHQRKNLSPLEEAAAIRALLDAGQEIETVARSLGRTRAWIARRSSLTELSQVWIAEIKNPESKIALWPPSHLELIARFPMDVQDRMLERWGHSWRWNVPTLDDLKAATGDCLRLLASAPWKQDDETLVPTAGACLSCAKRSSCAPELFPDELPENGGHATAGDHCLDPICWQAKAKAFLTRRIETLRRDYPSLILLNGGDYNQRAALAEAFQSEVFNAWDTAIGKKSDTGAVPALVVSGAGLGRLKWVVPATDGPTTPASRRLERIAHSEDSGNGNGVHERTADEKKAPYDKRRRQLVIDAIKAKLEALAQEPDRMKLAGTEGGEALTHRGLLARTLCFLTATLDEHGWLTSTHRGRFALPDMPAWSDLAQMKNHEIGTGETRDALLALSWDLLRLAVGRFALRLLVAPGERDNAHQYADGLTICELLGFDLAALRAQAAEAIPYAKCWRDDVQDDWTAPATDDQEAPAPAELEEAG